MNFLIPRGFLRAWRIAVEVVARGPEANGESSDSDREDNFHAKVGKRINRGRRNFADATFDFNLVFSLTALLPLHSTMGVLFAVSKIANRRGSIVSKVCDAVDQCVEELIDLTLSHVLDRNGAWLMVYHTRLGAAGVGGALFDDSRRLYCRRELMRILGGYAMRMVVPMSSVDVQLWIALESCSEEEAMMIASTCKRNACCVSSSSRRFHDWIRGASYQELLLAKASWSPSILATDLMQNVALTAQELLNGFSIRLVPVCNLVSCQTYQVFFVLVCFFGGVLVTMSVFATHVLFLRVFRLSV